MKINVPAGSPQFAVAIARDVERGFVSINPKSPVRLPRFDPGDLPDPTRFIGCLIWVNTTEVPAISDGTFWYPITLGAHL